MSKKNKGKKQNKRDVQVEPVNYAAPRATVYHDEIHGIIADHVKQHVEMAMLSERRRIDENIRTMQAGVDVQRGSVDRMGAAIDALRYDLEKMLSPMPVVRPVDFQPDAYQVVEALTGRELARFVSVMNPDEAMRLAQEWVDAHWEANDE